MNSHEQPSKPPLEVGSHLLRLRFTRRAVDEGKSVVPAPDEPSQRQRIQTCLEELRSISSKDELRKARDSGISISNSGFQARAGVGAETLRVLNRDLFDQLQDVLDYIHLEFLGVTRNRKGRSPGPKTVRKLSNDELKIKELEVLLKEAKAQILDLIAEIKSLRG